MSTYFAVHPIQENSPAAQWISPIGKDKSADYHSYHLQRTFGDRVFRTLLEERPLHTKRNMVGGELYNKAKQQTQVYFGPSIDQQIEAKKDGTIADYNAKLSLAANINKIEFVERVKQVDLETNMFYNRYGYNGTIDRKMQEQLDDSFRRHGHEPWKEHNGWKHSSYVSKLGGLQVSRSTTFG